MTAPYGAQAGGTTARASSPVMLSTLAMTLCVLGAGVAIYWVTMESLFAEWRDVDNLTYTHGFLIAALCVWLLGRSAQNQPAVPRIDWRAASLLAVGSVAWLITTRAGIELAHQALLPLLLLLLFCTVFGLHSFRRYGFALGYLYFAIPVWNLGNGILQAISVAAVRMLLQLTSVPAYVSGNVVHIPEGVFQIADGCSGIHFFIVALALAALFGEINRDTPATRIRQLLLAGVLAMISNWLRIYVIVLAGHLTDMQHYLVRVDHYYFGWLVFAFMLALFFWIASRDPAPPVRESESAAGASPFSRDGLIACLAGILVAALGPLVGAMFPESPAQTHSRALLPAIANWDGPRESGDSWRPIYQGSDRQQLGEYRRHKAVQLFVAEYDFQRQGKELVGYGNDLFNGLPATPLSEDKIRLSHGFARRIEFGDMAGVVSVVAYYYEIGTARETSPLAAQLCYGFASLAGAVTSRIVAARARCDSDCTAANSAVTELLGDLDIRKAVR